MEEDMQTYSMVRDHNQEVLRKTVVGAAEHVLLAEDASAVTVRRVAQQLGCSTTVIYNLFGSKDGLANALYQQGCQYLYTALAQVASDTTPRTYLTALAWAYWDFAQQNPQYYKLMFHGTLPDFRPTEASLHDVATAIGLVVDVLRRYRHDGLLLSDDVMQVAQMLWAALHGVIHLFFGGHFGSIEAARTIYAHTATTLIDTLLSA
jgi:AcrR family transcriptional regulator